VYAKSSYAGKVCDTCQLTKLGDDAMGWSVLIEGAGEEQKTFGGNLEDPLGLTF